MYFLRINEFYSLGIILYHAYTAYRRSQKVWDPADVTTLIYQRLDNHSSYYLLNTTLVPEAFFYSLLANFAMRIASYIFFYWHEALRAEKRKPLVATVGNLTFMPSAFVRRFWLENIFNCSMSHMIGWVKYLWGCEWSVYVHLYGYVWRTFALSTDSLTREG